jgi:hypothetical protein
MVLGGDKDAKELSDLDIFQRRKETRGDSWNSCVML